MVFSPYNFDTISLNPIVVGMTNKTTHSAQDNAERQRQCAADPKVQAAVSKLTAGTPRERGRDVSKKTQLNVQFQYSRL
jgi:hypothetical protein